jgi:hypothetical protein
MLYMKKTSTSMMVLLHSMLIDDLMMMSTMSLNAMIKALDKSVGKRGTRVAGEVVIGGLTSHCKTTEEEQKAALLLTPHVDVDAYLMVDARELM